MGGICSCQQYPRIQQFQALPAQPKQKDKISYKNNNISMRFGDVQKIRSGQNKSKFILTLQNSSQLVKVQLPIIRTYADQSILNIATINIDQKSPPIIDSLDLQTHRQFYHSVLCDDFHKSLKVYAFQNYHDPIFKNGLYQIALYHQIGSSYFRNAYLNERGNPLSLIMFFNSYDCTLMDIMLYRQLLQLRWTQDEQVYVTHKLINNYKKLLSNNIVHRDIRPSKIYVYSNKNKGKTKATYDNYEFANLQTGRKITSNERKQFGQQMLMTVRGVPQFCSQNVKNLHDRQQQLGTYNYQYNDRIQLLKTIISLDSCNPFHTKTEARKGHKLQKLCRKLYEQDIPFQKINRQINQLVKKINIQQQYGILKSDANIIDNDLLQLIKKTHKHRIQPSIIDTLFYTHQRDQFTSKLIKMVDQNYANQQPQLNIPVLHRLGHYYQSIGIMNNDYYRQQINLLVDLAQDSRKREFKQLSNSYLQKAQQLKNKLSTKMHTPKTMAHFFSQYAYNQYNKGNISNAQAYINQALNQGGKSNTIPIQNQLKIIQVKGLIQAQKNGPQAGDQYFQKGLQLCANRANFTTQIQMLENKAKFQHRLADNIIQKLKDRNIESIQRGKLIGKCQSLLSSANNTKSEIPDKNTQFIVRLNMSLGELYKSRQNYEQSLKYLQKAQRLYGGSEVQLSEQLKLRILNKMNDLYENNIDDSVGQEKVLKKIKKIKQKQQSKMRDPKKNFEKIKFLSQKQKQRQKNRVSIFNKQGIIQQKQSDDDRQEQEKYWKSKYENKYQSTQ